MAYAFNGPVVLKVLPPGPGVLWTIPHDPTLVAQVDPPHWYEATHERHDR